MVSSSVMMGRVQRLVVFLCVAVSVSYAPSAVASSFTFQGQNAGLFPSANPSDTSVLMNSVSKPTTASTIPTITPASLIEQSIISQISTKIYNDIFKGTSASGYFDLGGGNTISYTRSGGYITVDIVNATTGKTTLTVLDQ
jgi:hypothetical protein